jgi:hypothetical protein
MTTPGSDRPRRGFLAGLAERLAPPVVPEDDDPSQPLVPPTAVKSAVVLAIVAGALYLFIGLVGAFNTNSAIDVQVNNYNAKIVECQEKVGGIGDQVTATPADDVKDLAATCKTLQTLTPEVIQSAKTQNLLFAVIIALMGVAAVAAGWFLRAGAKWAKRVLIGLIALAFIGTLLLGIGNLLLLVGTLLLAIAVMLTIVGRGGVYFSRVANRRRAT